MSDPLASFATDDDVEVIYPAPKRKVKHHASVSEAGEPSAARRDV
jgi:hypothetical protein